MFSTPASLKKRTGKADINRFNYLKELVNEYTSNLVETEKKEQVLANLANFAYDPINYEFFKRLNIIDLFINGLRETNHKIVHFSIAGICNLCLEQNNKEYLLRNNLVNLILNCLCSEANNQDMETILNILTTILFLIEDQNFKNQILNFQNDKINFKSLVSEFSKSTNKRLSNLAVLIIEHFS